MRMLQGKRVVDAPATWRDTFAGRRVVIDVGAGDGRWAYEEARRDSGALYVALDPDADSLAEYAFRASRKPARGGAANVLFVVAAAEDLPTELHGTADLLRVNFPWGSLLRGLVLPELAMLRGLALLARPGARFQFVLSYDPNHDLAGLGGELLPPLSIERIDRELAPVYAAAGLEIEGRRLLPLAEAVALPSTWARRLLHGRPRNVFMVEGRIDGDR